MALAVGVIGTLRLSARRTRLALIDGRLIFSGLLHDRVLAPNRIVEVDVRWSQRRTRLWMVVNAAGRTEVALNRAAWDGEQLGKVRTALRLPIETINTGKRPADLRKMYPGTIPWWEAHPVSVTLIAIALVSVLVLALQSVS